MSAAPAGWQLASSRPGTITTPEQLSAATLGWHEAVVPGTVASAMQRDSDTPGPYDRDDWWYRGTLSTSPAAGSRHYLRLDGLATLAQVWFNGELVVESQNMFVGHRVDVSDRVREKNEVLIRFASLDASLAKKRPRGRWRTALVAQQGLRWIRTTLLGRIPGWTPPIASVGPWAPVALERVDRVEGSRFELRASGDGRLQVRANAESLTGAQIEEARLRVGDSLHALPMIPGKAVAIAGDVRVANAPRWWPHTHGEPVLVACTLELRIGAEWMPADCARVGFRDIGLDATDGQVRISVNGVSVFCRGAVWTPVDIRALRANPVVLRSALELLRDGGLNMLRVGGTMVYEQDEFYRLCDELGILVWQDFMFANMDYPVGDAAFREEIVREATHQLGRLRRHACIAAFCGGSEVAQQAAMMGLPAEQWSNDFFDVELRKLCEDACPGVPYFPSTPWGGALPFHVGTGISHYYGVGAYRRPLADVKSARVRFTPECLGFSNVPERATMDLVMDGATPPPHHPRWKARVPRDSGAGWDFEDIRDHYLRVLFGHDPVALRSEDLERYYALSRVASGEAMLRTFAEWRAQGSSCGGALVWFLRDLWPGAGWGVVDSTGLPKAAWWHLRRAWKRQAVLLLDEGLDGLAIHVVNESAVPREYAAEIQMLRHGRDVIASASAQIDVPARSTQALQADALLGRFTDSTHAYRFGPPKHDVVAARLLDRASGAVIAEDFHFPVGLDLPVQREAPECRAEWLGGGRVAVTVKSGVFLQSVSLDCAGWIPDDNYFHLVPGYEKRVVLTALATTKSFRAELEALNLSETATLRAEGAAL